MEKNHSLSNSHVRTKVRPHVRYNKETDEVVTSVTYEEEVVLAEPTTADEYNKEFTERFYKYEENKIMGKVKESIPAIEYEPFYVPVGREILDSISRVIIQQRTLLDRMVHRNPSLDSDVDRIDLWLAEMYSKHNETNGSTIKSGNGYPVCEEED